MAASAMLGLLYDAVTSVESFVRVFVYVYSLLILAYVLTSWVRMPYRRGSTGSSAFSTTSVTRICASGDACYRRSGPLDLSPVLGVAFLYIFLAVITNILDRLH